ncbi:hypothetical protein [Xanthobacter sp. 126]|uniref:hypothetical protein n=1 Tax=Xanthobacter sp. 126 TaxID=1131814 RepID=UPI00045EB023|nr:hypothetical protein [Xanthobacter sp. 126]
MTIFAIMAREANPSLQQAIDTVYKDKNYRIADRTWLVSDTATAKQVTEKLGVKKGGITGVVVMPTTNSYYGVAATAVWDWLRASIEASSDG